MRIVYATDGSERAHAGAQLLASLPLGPGTTVTLLVVAPTAHGTPPEMRHTLHIAREIVKRSGAHLSLRVRWGNASDEILNEVEEVGADLVVIGDTGMPSPARLLLEGTADAVLHHAPCSVLVARPLKERVLQNVLVGIDEATIGTHHPVVPLLMTLPLPTGCHLHLTTVVFPRAAVAAGVSHHMLPYISEEVQALSKQARAEARANLTIAKTRLESHGYMVTAAIRTGDPACELISAASKVAADLVVIGARGHSAIDQLLLGSVSERLLRRVSCSVLCARTGKNSQDMEVIG